MQEISFTEFKKLKARDIKELKSFKVYSNGDLLFMCVVPQGETLIRSNLVSQVEAVIEINNVFGGKDPCSYSDGVLQPLVQ